jgi:hypothetical protein
VRTALCRKERGETVPIHTTNASSVFEKAFGEQHKKPVLVDDSRQPSRAERRAALTLSVGEAFNPFNLFDGALIPTEVLRYSEITPSEKLVFGRLLQFAGARGYAWPSLEVLAAEVSLSVVQARRCVSALETKGLIRRVARSGRSNEFEFLWHPIYEQEHQPQSSVIAPPQSSMIAPPRSQMIDPPGSPKIGPGRSSMTARRESIQSIKHEENHLEENQLGETPQAGGEQPALRENATGRSNNRRLEQTRQKAPHPILRPSSEIG